MSNYSNYLASRKCCDLRGIGPQGAQGAQGIVGRLGPMGLQGSTGSQGSTGPPGLPTISTLSDVLRNGNSAGVYDIDMNSNDIINVNSITATATSDLNLNSNTGVIQLTTPNKTFFNTAIASTGDGTLNVGIITLTDGLITNTINKNGYTTKNTTANVSHFLNFSDSSATGIGLIQKTTGIECNPSTKTITATTFDGTATNATNIGITSDDTSGTYYLPFVKTSASGNKPLFFDDTTTALTYNPNTSSLSLNAITLNATPSTVNVASRFGQVGLVKLQTLSVAITGSASAVNFNLASIFNSTYKNYRIELSPTTQVSFTAYPSYSLQAFLGTGTLPTTASLYGYEMTSASTTVVAPVYTAGATLSSAPLQFAVSSLTNKQVVFEVLNVGFTATATQNVYLSCKSFYGNPGISGVRDANIATSYITGATITGLTIQQGALSVGNNMTIQAIIYGYNQL